MLGACIHISQLCFEKCSGGKLFFYLHNGVEIILKDIFFFLNGNLLQGSPSHIPFELSVLSYQFYVSYVILSCIGSHFFCLLITKVPLMESNFMNCKKNKNTPFEMISSHYTLLVRLLSTNISKNIHLLEV